MGAISPLPPIKVRAGFASNPLDASQTWTDISQYVRKIRTNRGRQHILNTFEPGRLSLELHNLNRLFDPLNSDGTWFGQLDINKQIQVLVTWNHLAAAVGGATMSSGWTGTNCAVTYVAGNLVLTSSASGTMSAITATGTGGFAVEPGQNYSAVASVKSAVSVRACSVDLLFYDAAGALLSTFTGATSNDNTSTYTQVTNNAATVIAPATAAFAALRVVVAATGAANEVHTWQQAGVFPAASVSTWQAGGDVPIYTGFIDTIPQLWPDNIKTGATISATDALRLMASARLASSPYKGLVLTDTPTNFWRFNDATGPTAADLGSAPIALSLNGGYTLGVAGPPIDNVSSVQFAGSGGTAGNAVSGDPNSFIMPAGSAQAWTFETWFKSSATSTGCTILHQPTFRRTYHLFLFVQQAAISLYCGTDGHIHLYADMSGGGDQIHIDGSTNLLDGAWHLVQVTRAADGKSWQLYVDNASVGTAAQASARDMVGAAAIGGLANVYAVGSPAQGTVNIADSAIYTSVLGATQIAARWTAASTQVDAGGWVQQDSGARINAILDIIGWPSAWRTINTGDTTVIVPATSLLTTSALSYAQQVTTSEHGFLFVDATGYVRFIHRTGIYQAPYNVSQAIFGDDGTNTAEIPYGRGPDYALDNVDLYNASSVQRSGGVTQTVIGTTQSQYGVLSILAETGLLFTQDTEALNRAQWNVAHFQTPVARVRAITVNPTGGAAQRFPQVINRELLDRVTFKRRPYSTSKGWAGTLINQDYSIEGIDHEIDLMQRTWQTTYHLYPADTQGYWVLGDAVNGILDSTTRLAY